MASGRRLCDHAVYARSLRKCACARAPVISTGRSGGLGIVTREATGAVKAEGVNRSGGAVPYVGMTRVVGVWAGWQGWDLAKISMAPGEQHVPVAVNRAWVRAARRWGACAWHSLTKGTGVCQCYTRLGLRPRVETGVTLSAV